MKNPEKADYKNLLTAVRLKQLRGYVVGTGSGLTLSPETDPFDRIVALGNIQRIPVFTPVIGEPIFIQSAISGLPWWETVDISI